MSSERQRNGNENRTVEVKNNLHYFYLGLADGIGTAGPTRRSGIEDFPAKSV
jgi:hypothetical protein